VINRDLEARQNQMELRVAESRKGMRYSILWTVPKSPIPFTPTKHTTTVGYHHHSSHTDIAVTMKQLMPGKTEITKKDNENATKNLKQINEKMKHGNCQCMHCRPKNPDEINILMYLR